MTMAAWPADMGRLHPFRSKRAGGFSLIEVLVALMILSVGALGIAAMMAVSLKSKNGAYSRTQANILAYTILDRMRANRATAIQHGYDIALGAPASSPPPGDCIGLGAHCTPDQIANLDLSQWKDSLAHTLPAGDGSIHTVAVNQMTQVTQVTISVQWNDKGTGQSADSGGAPAAANFTFVLSSGL